MGCKKHFSTFIALLFVCLPLGYLHAVLGIDPTNGYRYDKISSFVDVFDPEDTLIATDDLVVDKIRFYQLGIKEKWNICNVVLYVDGDYGWVDKGKYHDTITIVNTGQSQKSEAHVHKGKAKDLTVGLGYSLSFLKCFSISGMAGWSYHMLEVKIKDATFNGLPDPILDGLTYNNRWQGPWLGADVGFDLWVLQCHAGYEYHWGDWRATWRLDGPDVINEAFSDRRRASNAQGQVFYVDGSVNLGCDWSFGIGVKYQKWKATDGHLKPLHGSFADVGLPATEVDKMKHASWTSYAITCDLGYFF